MADDASPDTEESPGCLVNLELSSDSDFAALIRSEPSDVIAGLMTRPGGDFLRWVVVHLQASLGFDFAFVGELTGDDWSKIRTLAVCHRGEVAEGFEYDLKGSPCEDVMAAEICYCCEGGAEAYPSSPLGAMQLQSYVGISLAGEPGVPLGIAVLVHSEKISESLARRATAKLRLFRARLEAELTYRTAMRTMELAASEALTSQSTLEQLTEVLAKATRMRCAFVAVRAPSTPELAETVALFIDGKKCKNLAYPLAGTPCEDVEVNRPSAIHKDLLKAYPNEQFLIDLNAEAFFGIAVSGKDGELLGQIALIHDRPVKASPLDRPLFRLLATRLGAELRRRSEENQRLVLERRLMDAQRRQSLGVLAGGVAHDFNNLLCVISGHSQLVRSELTSHPELSDQLETILTASNQAAELCRQLLTYSGRQAGEMRTLDLNDVIRRTERLTRIFATENASMRFTLSEAPIWIRANEAQLQQIVLNLVKNAADALSEIGSIVLETQVSERRREDFEDAVVGSNLGNGTYATLTIIDDGCGMAEDNLRAIFDPFFSTKASGHGLGLAAVLGIVESHSGSLEVKSSAQAGSTFKISLPLAAEPDHKAQQSPPPSGEGLPPGSRVLVIDDDPLVLGIVAATLKCGGLLATLASNGKEGVRLFEALHETLLAVILDLSMPHMSGEEVLVELRRIAPDVPVVLASGNADREVIANFRERPDAVIDKPFDPEALVNQLRDLVLRR
jgi:two-component system, cell cycle sensor histidine kinase and response regulator CckA